MDIVRYMAPERRIQTVQMMLDMGAIDEQRAEELLRGPDGLDLTDQLKRNAADEGQLINGKHTKCKGIIA